MIRPGRLGAYFSLVFWLGGVAHANWLNFLDGYWFGFTTTAVIGLGILAVLVFMYRRDRKREDANA